MQRVRPEYTRILPDYKLQYLLELMHPLEQLICTCRLCNGKKFASERDLFDHLEKKVDIKLRSYCRELVKVKPWKKVRKALYKCGIKTCSTKPKPRDVSLNEIEHHLASGHFNPAIDSLWHKNIESAWNNFQEKKIEANFVFVALLWQDNIVISDKEIEGLEECESEHDCSDEEEEN